MDKAKIQKIVDEIWPKVREKHLYPPLPKPKVDKLGNTVAFISAVNKQIIINFDYVLEMSRKLEIRKILEAILDHEIAHYTFCPWDVCTHVSLYMKSLEITKNKEKARILTDYFMDVVVNTYCVSEMETNIPSFYKVMDKSSFDKLICSLYQKIWDYDLGVEEFEVAKKLAKIPYLDRNKWERSIKLFSLFLRDYIDKTSKYIIFHPFDRYSEDEISRGLRKIAVKFRDPLKFKKIIEILGKKESAEFAALAFYRELAEEYKLLVERKKIIGGGGLYPFILKSWEFDEPLNDLDLFNSYGKILPSVTKIWRKKDAGLETKSEKVPDCLIIIDSSGSMTNPFYKLSFAVLGAMCAANAYLDRNSKVAVYNFGYSDEGSELIVNYTKDRNLVHRAIITYFGGGTTINLKNVEKLVQLAGNPDVFMITDMEIYNLEDVIKLFKKLNNRITIVYLKTAKEVKKIKRELSPKKNIAFYSVFKKEDIPKIILGRVSDILPALTSFHPEAR